MHSRTMKHADVKAAMAFIESKTGLILDRELDLEDVNYNSAKGHQGFRLYYNKILGVSDKTGYDVTSGSKHVFGHKGYALIGCLGLKYWVQANQRNFTKSERTSLVPRIINDAVRDFHENKKMPGLVYANDKPEQEIVKPLTAEELKGI